MFKFLPYILKNMMRNKVRTFLTIGIVAISAFIFTYFMAFSDSWNSLLNQAGKNALLIIGQKNVR